MKIVIFAAGLSVILAGAALTSTKVEAQACSGTCSNAESTCKRTGTDAKDCATARKQCMQTGVFTNPRTGRTFSNICKN
jgi:hypothetical protein